MSTTTVCDGCGKEIKDRKDRDIWEIEMTFYAGGDVVEVDICKECFDKVIGKKALAQILKENE
jgi:hypothetical protein